MKDPALRSVSFAARGLWMDMLCLIHEVNQNGKLVLANGKPIGKAQLSRMVGGSEKEISELLTELESAGVCSKDEDGRIFSRRMSRDQALRAKRRECGALGGNPNLVKQNPKTQVKQNPTPSVSSSASTDTQTGGTPVELPMGFPKTEVEARAIAGLAGCTEDFCAQVWNKAMSRGGCDAKGQPIRSFRHYLSIESSYDRQRSAQQTAPGETKKTGAWQLKAQIEAVDNEIQQIKNRGHEDSFGWNPANDTDRTTIKNLKQRRKELNSQLANL